MAAALRPEPAPARFIGIALRVGARPPRVLCPARHVVHSNLVLAEGLGHVVCKHKAQRHSDPCGAVLWLLAGLRFPWRGGGVLYVHTTAAELSRVEAAGLSVEQTLQHFMTTPHPDHR